MQQIIDFCVEHKTVLIIAAVALAVIVIGVIVGIQRHRKNIVPAMKCEVQPEKNIRKANSETGNGANENKKKAAKNNSRHGKSGWAHTKKYPHERHPARYKKRGSDDIDYLTFTHSEEVEMPNGDKVKTIPLTSNITPSERGKSISYVFPKVFKGKRSALGSETDEFSLTPEDKEIVEKLFDELPSQEVPETGGSGHYRKRKNKNSRK